MKYLLCIVIVLSVVGVLLFRAAPTAETAVVVEYRTDTVEVVRVDTVRIVEPYLADIKPLKEVAAVRVVDTIFQDRVVYLPLEQRRYTDGQLYELWVSGVEPKLDSIHLFSRTNTRTITNHLTESRRSWALYGSLMVNSVGDTYYPTIGLQLVTRGRWAYSLSVGSFERDMVFGVGFYYRLLGR